MCLHKILLSYSTNTHKELSPRLHHSSLCLEVLHIFYELRQSVSYQYQYCGSTSPRCLLPYAEKMYTLFISVIFLGKMKSSDATAQSQTP